MLTRTLLLFILTCSSAFALEDTPANRMQEAKRYMASTPPEALMQDMAKNMSMNLPPADRQAFRDLLLEHVNLATISGTIESSMVKTFTADELAALADFYESDIARSAMQKFGMYMADAMPTIQAEMTRAIGEMEKVRAAENRALPDLDQQQL